MASREFGKTKHLAIYDGHFECKKCDWYNYHYPKWDSDDPQTQICPECGSLIFYVKQRDALLPGQYSNNMRSDCYVRPDADCAYRSLNLFAKQCADMEMEGKLEKVDDYKETQKALECYAKHQDYFGSIDKPTKIEVPTDNYLPSEKEMFKDEPSMDDLLGRITYLTPPEIREKKFGALHD